MSTARRILENTAVQFGGKIITGILSIFVLKMVSTYLGVAGYGDYTIAYNFLAFFGAAADFGIYTITVKEMSKHEANIPEILGNVLGLRTIIITLMMGLAVIAAFIVPNFEGTLVPMGVLIASIGIFFTLLNGTISTVLQVHLKMQYTTIGLVIGKLVSVGYIALVVYTLFPKDTATGFEHLFWAGVLANLIMLVITTYYVAKYCKISYRFDFGFWKRIFWTSLPYGVALVLSNTYVRIDTQMLSSLLPSVDMVKGKEVCLQTFCGKTEASLYNVGLRFLEMLVIIPLYFMNSVMPTMTRFLEEGKEKVQRVIQNSFDFLMAVAMPILVGGFILATPIIQLISQENYLSGNEFTYGADLALQYLVFVMLLSFLNMIFSFTLVVLNRQKKLIYINAACLAIKVVGNLLLIPYFGFQGAAVCTIVCEVFILIFSLRAIKKDLDLHLNYKTAFKIMISSLGMGLGIWLIYMTMASTWFIWPLVVLIPLGALIYGGMLFLTRTLTPEMRAILRRK